MIGEVAVALTDLAPSGRIKVRGEIWNAWSRTPVAAGAHVRIASLHGLEAEVVPEGTGIGEPRESQGESE